MIPRIVPVALPDGPQTVYSRLAPSAHTALLESSKLMPGLSGWSYIAGPAFATLQTDAFATTLRRTADQAEIGRWADPFVALAELLPHPASAVRDGTSPGFTGGWLGYLGYDLARHVERLPSIALAEPAVPALRLLHCDHVLAHHHATAQWYFCTTPTAGAAQAEREQVWAQTLQQAQGGTPRNGSFSAGPATSRTSAEAYLKQVQQVLGLIAQGDIFQANLSHRLEAAFEGDPFALYQALTALNPAPFSAYLPADGFTIASVSPERFLKLTQNDVMARPIKGTLARAANAAQDAQQREVLRSSIKDRAENLMIVDLMRNDLGRVAQTGSVRVDELFGIEAHPSVWQMVSTIRARLRSGIHSAELLRACWPPGSMTGAPKVRAMEIIDSLEPVRRGPYAGAIGYVDASGDMDWSVVIRTAVVHQNRVMVQVGGAVVADSVPQQELDETYAKGRLLLQAMGGSRPAPGSVRGPAAPVPASGSAQDSAQEPGHG